MNRHNPFTPSASTYGFAVLNGDGTIRYCNEQLLRWIDATPTQCQGRSITTILPDFPSAIIEEPASAVGEPKHLHLQTFNGELESVQIKVRQLKLDDEGSLIVVVEQSGDVAEPGRRRDMARLRKSAEVNEDAIAITGCFGRIEFVNKAFLSMTGYQRSDLIGRTLMELQLGPQQIENSDNIWTALPKDKTISSVDVHRKKDGSLFHHEQSVRPFFDEQGVITHAVFTGRDVTERVSALQQLTFKANHDSLTGLPNRSLISDRLQQALKHAARNNQRFTVAILDIDHFKSINDSYGHLVGDLILCEVSARLQACLREEDTVGRFAGDEFTLILPNIDNREDAEVVINKIADACDEDFFVDDKLVSVSVSIGIAIYPLDGDSQQGLLECADIAMYRAKAKACIGDSSGQHQTATATLR